MVGGADIDGMSPELVSDYFGGTPISPQYSGSDPDGVWYNSSPWDAEGVTGMIASVYRLGPKRVASEVGALSEMFGVDAPEKGEIMKIYEEQIYVEGKPKQISMAEALEDLGLLNKEKLSSDTELYKALIKDLLLVPEVGPVAARREIEGLEEYAPSLTEDFDHVDYIKESYQDILEGVGGKRVLPRPADTIVGVYRHYDLIEFGPPKPMSADALRTYA